MKTIKKILALAAVFVATAACTDLTELNQDPTKATTIDPNLLIPTIQFSHAYGYQNCTRYLIYPGGWTNHWTGPYAVAEYGGKGKKSDAYMERLWMIMFPQAVRNITSLEYLTDKDPQKANLSAIAKVLRVETYLKLTDYYGDIPYFEGGMGYYGNILNPKYDKQEDIYNDFFVRLDQAAAQFDAGLPAPTRDLYFQGDIGKWKRFTNSLKLRIAMRLIKVDPAKAKQKATEAFQAGLMTSNADIAAVKYENDQQDEGAGNGYANALGQYVAAYGPSQYRMTTELLRALTTADTDSLAGGKVFRRIKAQDPRLPFIGRSCTDATKANTVDITDKCRAYNRVTPGKQGPNDLTTAADGYINIGGYLTVCAQDFNYGGGIEREYGLNLPRPIWAEAITTALVPTLPVASVTHYVQRLQPSKYVNASDAPWIHMTYAETQFLMAETSLRGWNIDNETVEQRYRKGYVAAVQQWSLFGAPVPATPVIETYMNDNLIPILSQGNAAALDEVCKQLWILDLVDPIEAWSLIRRTDGLPSQYVKFYDRYPAENQSNHKAPARMQYPLEEQTKNAASYKEAVARMGGTDDWTTHVWWDK